MQKKFRGKVRNHFLDLIGYSPESKILDYLIEYRETKLTFNDIVRASQVNRQRAYGILRELLRKGIIKEEETIKEITFYRLEVTQKQIKHLIQVYDSLIA